MIDTISIDVPIDDRTRYESSIAHLIKRTTTYTSTNNSYSSCSHENIKAFIKARKVTLTGSVPKYIHGSNSGTAGLKDLREFKIKIAERFNLDLSNATIKRLDTTVDLYLNKNPTDYFPLFRSLPKHERSELPNTLYFQSPTHTLKFYDKMVELGEKHPTQNWLRVESAHLNAQKSLGLKSPIAFNTLFEASTYTLLVESMLETFSRLSLGFTSPAINWAQIKSPSEIISVLILQGLQSHGSSDVLIDKLKRASAFKYPNQYTRLKQKLNSCYKSKDLIDSVMRDEIEEKFTSKLHRFNK